jgi:hypothetical protein
MSQMGFDCNLVLGDYISQMQKVVTTLAVTDPECKTVFNDRQISERNACAQKSRDAATEKREHLEAGRRWEKSICDARHPS